MAVARQRPTQAQRRASTRAKITAAGLEVLAAQGYTAMTFADVAERAGVSRGALLHYFPQKPDLALATIQDGAVVLLRDLRERVEASRSHADRDERILDDIYQVFTGPLFQAFLALQVHARTDRALNARLDRIAGEAVAAIGAIAIDGWGAEELAGHPELATFIWLVNDTIRGISLSSASDRADTGNGVWHMARPLLLGVLAQLRADATNPSAATRS
ncbi:MAG TPA: TetR/AcrR family transcriptional regulator [Solirubrobacteraceae bacterium]|jgi:AcrR family transcriptional regulator|nr:TetR/AcrR family transcriptional regulator [Solirubrobacteraceae bacterium]